MNAFNRYVEVGQAWFDTQVKVGQSWFESLKAVEFTNLAPMWDKTIDAYQASLQSTLDAEVAGTKIWFEEVYAVENLPQPAVDVVKQMQAATEKVTETQQTFADNWVTLLRKVDLKELPLAGIELELPKKAAPKAAKKAA
ncbi:MAG: hypothetical protein KDJ52_04285 [Anaerolineae bacterium]|nr:hypothetical protein [Anaerolineae bacterium]